MLWVTRSHVHVDRVACPWLITRFIDSEGQFLFVPRSEVMAVSEREAAIPFDRRRHGTLIGMGACGLVVESQDAVDERVKEVKGRELRPAASRVGALVETHPAAVRTFTRPDGTRRQAGVPSNA